MTAAQSGHLGGVATLAAHGYGHMRRIARKGGATGGRPRLRTLAEIEADTRGPRGRRGGRIE